MIATKFTPRTQEEIAVQRAGKREAVPSSRRNFKAVDLELTEDEISYLEELYVPHALAGVMAQNGKQKAGNVV